MAKHEKFILEELPETAVVNLKRHRVDNGIEELINSAVTEHIKKIVKEPESFNDSLESFDKKLQIENAEELIEPVEETQNSTGTEDNGQDQQSSDNAEEKKIVDESLESCKIVEQNLDIEQLKSEAYESGFAVAKDQFELSSTSINEENNLVNKLSEKLAVIIPEIDLDSQIAKLSAEAITSIAKKLHLILPVNFEEIISKGLIDKLNRFYKEGSITVKVHPDRYDFCSQILHSESIPAKFKNNFNIIKDDKLSKDDCAMEWEDTCFEYSADQLSAEIDKIIERLTNAA